MTLNVDCEQLEPYLSGDLSDKDVARFESHIEECAECRDAIDQQQWIDGLLRSPTRLEVEPVPFDLIEVAQASASRRHRRVQLAACGLATAAAILFTVGWTVLQRSHTTDLIVTRTPHTAPLQAQEKRSPEPARAMFVSDSDAIAIPLDSPDADVTVVQVYPTMESERRWQRKLAFQNTQLTPNGG